VILVPVSDDEVLVQAEYAESKPAAAAVATDLTLLLGDQVRFSGFGLDARIDGRLRISSKPAQPLLGEGAIALEEAYYKAYGQDLAVERGRLLFAGPLDNPGLDVRATRRSGEVVAVLELTGTASRPSARVFSEPPLPDAEAFAYLLTGKPLSGASSSDGAMLSGAALALGLDNADGVTRKIGRQLGLDEVGLTGGGSNAGLVLGKYLTPDIYLSYVLNLFGGEGAVQVEYKLTDSISVQGRTSAESQEVDLIYRYERD